MYLTFIPQIKLIRSILYQLSSQVFDNIHGSLLAYKRNFSFLFNSLQYNYVLHMWCSNSFLFCIFLNEQILIFFYFSFVTVFIDDHCKWINLNVYHLAAYMFLSTPFVVHILHNNRDHSSYRWCFLFRPKFSKIMLQHMDRNIGKFKIIFRNPVYY